MLWMSLWTTSPGASVISSGPVRLGDKTVKDGWSATNRDLGRITGSIYRRRHRYGMLGLMLKSASYCCGSRLAAEVARKREGRRMGKAEEACVITSSKMRGCRGTVKWNDTLGYVPLAIIDPVRASLSVSLISTQCFSRS